jgi:transposase
MANKKRRFSPEEKVRILHRHLIEKVPVSDVCDQFDLNPNVFYRWQKAFFENGAAAFARKDDAKTTKLEKNNQALRSKIARKDEVIAEIMAEHVELKKSLGED